MFIMVLFVLTQCIAVNITRIQVPALVEIGTESVVLDCEFSTGAVSPDAGLVVKWFFNGSANLVFQWIPPMRPQVIGLLKGKVDMNFRVSDEPLQAYRAIKILRPTTDLSGNYTCVVSTFLKEDRQTRPMLVYSPGKRFHFVQEKKYVFLVTLICVAEDLYPKPELTILSKGKPLKQAVTEMRMDSWGLYSVETKAVVHDDDVDTPWEEFICLLDLSPANYTINRTTIYYPGLMPTAYNAVVEVEKPQERHANANSLSSASGHVCWMASHVPTSCPNIISEDPQTVFGANPALVASAGSGLLRFQTLLRYASAKRVFFTSESEGDLILSRLRGYLYLTFAFRKTSVLLLLLLF